MRDQQLDARLRACRNDFEAVQGRPFSHFYCPILLCDEPAEIIRGHVVNAALRAGNTWVPQRRDVDGFFGSVVEADLTAILRDRHAGVVGVWLDPTLRRRHRPKLMLNGLSLDHYFTKRNARVPPGHTAARIVGDDGHVLASFAVKEAAERLIASKDGDIAIVCERDYRPSVIAALLKAAHLTLFHLLGYRHVLGPTGFLLADILRTFYSEHRGKHRVSKQSIAGHFLQFQAMMAPIIVQNEELLRGSVVDGHFLTCWTASDEIFAFCVIVKAGLDRFCVFLPSEIGKTINTYVSFLHEPPASVRARLTRFRPPSAADGGAWDVDTTDLRIPMNQPLPP